MPRIVRDLTFVADAPGYCLFANERGELVRVEGLSRDEIAQITGCDVRPSRYQTLLARIAELKS
jgi:hypothetical protein